MNVVSVGRQGLTGVRGMIGRKVARPVADRTSLSQEQVEAIIGSLLLALSAYRFVRGMVRVARAARAAAD
jgi:hypothetical protein